MTEKVIKGEYIHNPEDIFAAIVGRILCGNHTCQQCKEFLKCDECPTDNVEYSEMSDLIKELYEHMKDSKCYDLGSCPWDRPWDVNDLMDVINDVIK